MHKSGVQEYSQTTFKGDTEPRNGQLERKTLRPQKEANLKHCRRKQLQTNWQEKQWTPNERFLLAAQTTRQDRHRSTPVSHLHAPKVTPTRTQSVEEHGYTHLEYAGGTGITFIPGYWYKRSGGHPFPQMITHREKKACERQHRNPRYGTDTCRSRHVGMECHLINPKWESRVTTQPKADRRKTKPAIDGETPYQCIKTHKA